MTQIPALAYTALAAFSIAVGALNAHQSAWLTKLLHQPSLKTYFLRYAALITSLTALYLLFIATRLLATPDLRLLLRALHLAAIILYLLTTRSLLEYNRLTATPQPPILDNLLTLTTTAYALALTFTATLINTPLEPTSLAWILAPAAATAALHYYAFTSIARNINDAPLAELLRSHATLATTAFASLILGTAVLTQPANPDVELLFLAASTATLATLAIATINSTTYSKQFANERNTPNPSATLQTFEPPQTYEPIQKQDDQNPK